MGEILTAGAKAPDFNLPRENGEKISLKSLRGSKVVLYFYPRADTPGCTKEAIAFNGKRKEFERLDTTILGVSADPVTAQEIITLRCTRVLPKHLFRTAYNARHERETGLRDQASAHLATHCALR